MQPQLSSWGLGVPGQTGTMVLGDGSRSGLIFVSGAVWAQLGAFASTRAQAQDPETESGGLLIGPVPGTNDLLIEEAIPFEIEYRFDASMGPSLAGLESIQRAIANAQNDTSKSILGFYRIRTIGLSAFSGHYLEILDHIAEMHSSLAGLRCCLALGPAMGSEVPLRVAVRGEAGWEEIDATTLNMEAPPRPALNGNHVHLEAEPLRPEVPFAAPVETHRAGLTAAESADSRPAAAPRRGRGALRIIPIFAGLAMVLLTSASGLFWWKARGALSQPITRTERFGQHTGFSANPDGSAWKLTWNIDTVTSMSPTGAILSIDDGPEHQDIDLTMADLSSGTIYYKPKTGQLAFRFQLKKEGVNIAEERVRVLDKMESTGNPATQAKGVEGRGWPGIVAGVIGRTPQSEEAAPPPVEPAHHEQPRTFVPPQTSARTVQTDPISAAVAPITSSTIKAPLSADITTTFKAPAPPSEPPLETPPPVQSQPQTQAAPAATKTSLSVASPQSRYEPARVTKQVQPRTQDGSRVDRETVIKLQVVIDENGKVAKITPIGSTPDIRLLAAATHAARYWEFTPARLNGRGIASEMILSFRF